MKQKISISILHANLWSIIIILPLIIIQVYLLHYFWDLHRLIVLKSIGLFLGCFVTGIFLHEFIHASTWIIFGSISFKEIKFGMHWKYLTPYVHLKVPLTARPYRWGIIMPGLVLGILPSSLGIITGQSMLMLLGIIFTAAAGGDFLILWLLRKVPSTRKVQDHPTEPGCWVLDSEESYSSQTSIQEQ
jgi:hypothetical protein